MPLYAAMETARAVNPHFIDFLGSIPFSGAIEILTPVAYHGGIFML